MVMIRIYRFHHRHQIATVNNMITSILVENDDPTGIVTSRTSLQEQFGGYYNIQKIMKATGVSNITLASVDDVAVQTGLNKYNPYSIILRQTLSLQGNLERTKRINLLIAEAPTFDITVASSLVELGNHSGSTNLTTNCRLFGARMPDSNIVFNISNFNVTNINNNWVWPRVSATTDTPFMDLSFNYFYNKTGSHLELDQLSEPYAPPVLTSKIKNWDINEFQVVLP